MSRLFSSCLIFLSLLFVCSCNKDAAEPFTGSYRYNMSGTITFEEVSPAEGFEPDIRTFDIVAESGRLNLISEGGNKRRITMTSLLGDAISSEGLISGNSFDFELSQKKIYTKILAISTTQHLNLKAKAEVVGNMLIIKFNSSDVVKLIGVDYKIISNNIECIAQLND